MAVKRPMKCDSETTNAACHLVILLLCHVDAGFGFGTDSSSEKYVSDVFEDGAAFGVLELDDVIDEVWHTFTSTVCVRVFKRTCYRWTILMVPLTTFM